MHLFCMLYIISGLLTILNTMKCYVETCCAVLLRGYYKKKSLYVFSTDASQAWRHSMRQQQCNYFGIFSIRVFGTHRYEPCVWYTSNLPPSCKCNLELEFHLWMFEFLDVWGGPYCPYVKWSPSGPSARVPSTGPGTEGDARSHTQHPGAGPPSPAIRSFFKFASRFYMGKQGFSFLPLFRSFIHKLRLIWCFSYA